MADFNEEINERSPVRLMGRILRFIFTTNSAIWFEKDLTEPLSDYQTKLPVGIDITSTRQTIEWLKSQNQSWVVHPQEISTALKYNHCWPSVCTNGKIIGCIKIGFGNVYIADYNSVVELPDKIAIIYDTYILKGQRGKGIAKYLITQATKFLKAKGYTKVKCHIPPWNKASISAYEKIGFKKVSYIRYFRIFGIPIRRVNPLKKKHKSKDNKIVREAIPK